jgi:hypothetical protein
MSLIFVSTHVTLLLLYSSSSFPPVANLGFLTNPSTWRIRRLSQTVLKSSAADLIPHTPCTSLFVSSQLTLPAADSSVYNLHYNPACPCSSPETNFLCVSSLNLWPFCPLLSSLVSKHCLFTGMLYIYKSTQWIEWILLCSSFLHVYRSSLVQGVYSNANASLVPSLFLHSFMILRWKLWYSSWVCKIAIWNPVSTKISGLTYELWLVD